MVDLGQVFTFLGGLGIGSVITAVVQHWLSQRGKKEDNRFTERKNAFDRFWDAAYALTDGATNEKNKQFGICIRKVELVASQPTVQALKRFVDSAPGTDERTKGEIDLKGAMRRDLGVG